MTHRSKSLWKADDDGQYPAGRTKLFFAFCNLLEKENFESITTAKLSQRAGVNEALIYRYFNNKRGLLHKVTEDYLLEAYQWLNKELSRIEKPKEKLRSFISNTIEIYNQNRVFAKSLLLEVRNFKGFFKSNSYRAVKNYSRLLTDILKAGAESGDFRNDMDVRYIRDLIIGSIEHYVMPDIIFNRKFDPDLYAENLCKLVFEGVVNSDFHSV